MLKKSAIYIILLLLCVSCEKNADVEQFRTGTYKTYLDDSDEVSTAIRSDAMQIEIYNEVRDTFSIRWKSNFEYELKKINPKKGLDSVPFYVKITGIKGNTYTFKANYKGSNFKQQGKAVKQTN